MDTYTLIESLRKQRGISQARLEKDLGFSNGSVSKWKKSKPTTERLQKVAEYFGVPLQYLITGSMPVSELDMPSVAVGMKIDNPAETLRLGIRESPAHAELKAIYDGLDDYDRETLMRVARALASKDSCSSRS